MDDPLPKLPETLEEVLKAARKNGYRGNETEERPTTYPNSSYAKSTPDPYKKFLMATIYSIPMVIGVGATIAGGLGLLSEISPGVESFLNNLGLEDLVVANKPTQRIDRHSADPYSKSLLLDFILLIGGLITTGIGYEIREANV